MFRTPPQKKGQKRVKRPRIVSGFLILKILIRARNCIIFKTRFFFLKKEERRYYSGMPYVLVLEGKKGNIGKKSLTPHKR